VVFDSTNVAGQIWSYLLAMEASGVAVPMGAIMTYEKIAAVTLQDLSKDDEHRQLLNEAKQALKKGISPLVLPPLKEEDRCKERKESPTNRGKRLRDIKTECNNVTKCDIRSIGSKDSNDKDSNQQMQSVDRKVFRSRVYEKGDVFPFLLQALWMAFRKGNILTQKEAPQIFPNDAIGRRLVFKLDESSFDWGITPKLDCNGHPFKAIVDNALPDRSTQTYCILDKLSSGDTAAVYLACNLGGKVCAIKEYYLKPSFAATNEERENEEDYRREQNYEKAIEEQMLWSKLYGDRFKTRVQYLGAKPCLLMPYGHEIVDEAAERWLCVPEIRDQLVYFAEQGYVYGSHDLRWSYVLHDMNKKLFLCDLEYIQEHPRLKCDKPTDTVLSDAVYQQLLSLLQVLSQEKLNIKETFKWATDPSHHDEVASLVTNNKTLQHFFFGLKVGEVWKCLGSLFNDVKFHSLSPMAKAAVYMLGYLPQFWETER
jgi:hypothetical protein